MHEERIAYSTPAPVERRAPLSRDSAASVRGGVLAVLHHGARYLPVVDDGTLVGIVAVRELGRLRPDPGTAGQPHGPIGHAGSGQA